MTNETMKHNMFDLKDEIIELKTFGEPIFVLIRKSIKAKHVSIRATYKGVQLILPIGAKKEEAFKFLLSKEKAIREQLKSYEKQFISPQDLCDELPISGEIHKINYVYSNKSLAASINNKVITIHSHLENLADTLINYLKNYILDKITILTQEVAAKHQFKYNNISVKKLGTRWGSCSSRGNLSFNWRIVFAPPAILFYLIVHELCHLIEMNHSSRFWNLVKGICPDYKTSESWLKKNGYGLYQYLPAY